MYLKTHSVAQELIILNLLDRKHNTNIFPIIMFEKIMLFEMIMLFRKCVCVFMVHTS